MKLSVALASILVLLVAAAPAQAKSPAQCGPNDRLETGLQGQIPLADRVSGRAEKGYNCNLDEVGAYASTAFANFDTYKDCAYYSDTIGLTSAEGGTIVLDVSDPRRPVKTDYLTARAATNAGESLRVNLARGILVADRYTISGVVGKLSDLSTTRSLAVYDLKQDCRHPKLLADVIMPRAIGHEGCFQPDGMVYYMGDAANTITPIDLTDPTHPKELTAPVQWGIHGCSTSDDGNRGYFADIGDGRMRIVDTSEVQARKPGAKLREIGRFDTPNNKGQQSTIPVSYKGKPYLIDWSEFTTLGRPCIPGDGRESNFGYAQILDISNETYPKRVSKMQTEVQLPQNCPAVLADRLFLTVDGLTAGDVFPIVGSQVFLYDTHYCSTDRLHDPTLLACSSFGSGLRVYDIRDPRVPEEIAYWNGGTVSTGVGALLANAAVARPVIRTDLGQIWFPDAYKGFHVLQFREGVWPFAGQSDCPHDDYYVAQYNQGYKDCRAQRHKTVQLPSAKPCRTTREMDVRLRSNVRVARVYVNGKRVRLVRNPGSVVRVGDLPTSAFTVKVVARTKRGTQLTTSRRYRTCVPSGKPPATRSVSITPFATQQLEQILALCRLAATRT